MSKNQPTFPPSFPPLPIDEVLPDLKTALARASSAILVAEPGAGKTTRVPLALLDADFARQGKILLLTPRRVAARAAAAQMSRLLDEKIGGTVGYRVRLETKISARTRIEVITEGIFTRMIVNDPELAGVGAVIFDEFHERSLDADLGLALALDVQAALRPDLRLLVMSATLDAARVSALMNEAPVIAAKGRSFPVDTYYLPPAPQEKPEDTVVRAVMKALREETGSLLVFLPGAREIERSSSLLRERIDAQTILAPLYGALDLAAQDLAIAPAPAGKRKIVLASAIAETSLTIEGVRVVIDSGFSRVPRFDPDSGLTRLETVRVSQASAEQRRGRAGRLERGICYRLWAEGQTRALLPFNRPEILEADLAPLVLDCAASDIAQPEHLKFLDPPPAAALSEARKLLHQLDALDSDHRITQTGRKLAAMPLPPRLAHMLFCAAKEGAGAQAARIAALLTEHGLGGNAVDLAERLSAFEKDKSPRAQQAMSLAQTWLNALGDKSSSQKTPPDTGEILSLAFPDRFALRRAGKANEYLMANGKGAYLDPVEPLSREPCLVIAEAQGSSLRARILLAARFTREKLEARFASHIVSSSVLEFDMLEKRVRGRNIVRLGALVLKEQPLNIESEDATGILLDALKTFGFESLEWPEHAKQLLARLAFLHRLAPSDWPHIDLATLREKLDEWLLPYIPGVTSFTEIAPQIGAALAGLLTEQQRRALDLQAPAYFKSPLDQDFRIDYEKEGGPGVSLRVQQLYGLKTHPLLGNGKVPLAFELLSPASRPIQLTRDLPAFWQGSWADVRREMRGRYPRHEWPEDPASAKPTTRAKPRK